MTRHFDAVASVLDIEKKIGERIEEVHRQSGWFVELLALVHEGRGKEALRVDLEKLVVHQGPAGGPVFRRRVVIELGV